MIVLSAGMPKSGTAWYFNVTNDLLIAAGYADARIVRRKFHLHPILKHPGCYLKGPTWLKPTLLIPHCCGYTFAVKTHESPTRKWRMLAAAGVLKPTYIYRDPRDVALSAFEHGQKLRQAGKTYSFAPLTTIEAAIYKTRAWLEIWEAWKIYGQAFMTRYEALITNPLEVMQQMIDFFALPPISEQTLLSIAQSYEVKNLPNLESEKGGLHFNQGKVGRFRQVMTPAQLDLCQKHLGDYIEEMGYTP